MTDQPAPGPEPRDEPAAELEPDPWDDEHGPEPAPELGGEDEHGPEHAPDAVGAEEYAPDATPEPEAPRVRGGRGSDGVEEAHPYWATPPSRPAASSNPFANIGSTRGVRPPPPTSPTPAPTNPPPAGGSAPGEAPVGGPVPDEAPPPDRAPDPAPPTESGPEAAPVRRPPTPSPPAGGAPGAAPPPPPGLGFRAPAPTGPQDDPYRAVPSDGPYSGGALSGSTRMYAPPPGPHAPARPGGSPAAGSGSPQSTSYMYAGADPYAPAAPRPGVAVGGQSGRPGSLIFVESRFGRVADFGERVVAGLIDLAVTIGGFVVVLLGILVLALSSGGVVTLDNGARVAAGGDSVMTMIGVLLVVLGYLTMIALWAWNRVFMMGRTGRSIGKRARGLKLVDATTGEPIGASKAFLRELVHWLANSLFYLSYLWMLWDPNKQTLGDKAVGSAVIHRTAEEDGDEDEED